MRNKLIIIVCVLLCSGIFLILLNVDKDKKKDNITTTTTTQEVSNESITSTKTIKEDVSTTKKKITTKKNTSKKTTKNTSTKIITSTKTTKKSTSKETTTKKYIVDTKIEQVVSTETKYGVIIKTITDVSYNIYNDGSIKESGRDKKYKYDRSGYNATSSELKSEATKLVNNNSKILNDVLNYTNNYRNEVGKENLTLDKNLSVIATIRALEIAWADKFSHTRPNGKDFYTVLNELNISYQSAGENIAAGYGSAKSVSEGWKNSEGHYKNMISDNYKKLGVGYVKHNETKYWVQIFSN